ncbi:MAG: DUF2065 domain-containing protein [Beijerinckiaceae bacterium]
MEDFLSALALLFVIEGLLFAAFPDAARRAMLEAASTPEGLMRRIGLISAVGGIVALYIVKRLL